MVSITTLSYLNLITILLFAFTIKTGILETFLSKIGNLRVKRLAKNFADENEILFNIRPGNPFGMEGTENTQPAKDMKKQACDWPWKAVSINWDGSVIPCCEYVVWKGASPHKNYSEQNLLQTWNGSSYIDFRKEHKNNGRVNLEVCKDCPRQGLGFKF